MASPGNLHCISCICALALRSGTDSPGGVCVSTDSPGGVFVGTDSPGGVCVSTDSPGGVCVSTDSPGGVCVSQPPTNTTASQQFSAQLNLLVSYVQYVWQSARQSVHYQHCFIQHFTSKNHRVLPLPLLHSIPHTTPSFLSLPFPIPHPFPLLPQNSPLKSSWGVPSGV